MDVYTHARKDRILWIIAFILIFVLIAGVIVALTKIDGLTTTATLKASAFSVGTINEDGEYEKDKGFIYTENYIKAQNIEVLIAEDADIQYRLFYYKDGEKDTKEFVSASDWLTTDFKEAVPSEAAYVRIVIEPLKVSEISNSQIRKFAKQLTVTYLK